MGLTSRVHSITIFLGQALLVAVFSRLVYEIPGTGGFRSDLTEVALILLLPLIPHWTLTLPLAVLAGFSGAITLEKFLVNGLGHALTYPLLWLAYRRWGSLPSIPRFVGLWPALIAAYYAILVSGTFVLQALWEMRLPATFRDWPHALRAIGNEYLATAFIGMFYLLMIRELRLRKAIQSDLEARNTELSRHKQLLEAQYDATQEGILVVSPSDRRIFSWNHRFTEIWKVPQDILLSGDERRLFAHALEVVEDPEAFSQAVSRLYADPEATQQDLLRMKDGRTLVRFTTPVRYGSRSKPERMWFFRDITELKDAQEKHESMQARLFQSQKMEAIGQLAGGVAHDFNNSLGVILGAAELAGIEDIPATTRSYLDMIVTSAQRASSLTRKLLSFSRQGSASMAPIDAKDVVQDTVSLLRSSLDRRIAIQVEDETEWALIEGDKGLLQNALMNLGINASHAMPEGGTLAFGLRAVDLEAEYCQASPFELVPGKYLEVSVRDTGCGIAPEHLPRIFEPFFTTKEDGKGTGLGLASVYGAVQDHRGAVSVYSRLGIGTIFRIVLPLLEDALSLGKQDSSLHPDDLPTGTATVLLVDDEEMMRRTATLMLEGLGYRVLTASDGLEALALFRDRGERIDLILLDMIMPRKGGIETLKAIRNTFPSFPVVICSGFSRPGDLETLQTLGISAILPKPYLRSQLAQAVAAALAGKPYRAESSTLS